MMAFSFLSIALSFTSFSIAEVTEENAILKLRYNLKIFLDWSHKFSQVYEEQKTQYIKENNARLGNFVIARVAGFPETVSGFISAAAQLRNILVKGDNDCIISDNLAGNARLFTVFICNMPLVLDDLKESLVEWDLDRPILRHLGTVMDEYSLEWFKDHGFDESSLNDITISELEVVIYKFYSYEKPFDNLLSFFGIPYTSTCIIDVGSKLGWLFTYGNNPKALHCLEMYLRREGSTVQPETTDKIIGELSRVGDDEGTLSQLLGNGRDGGLHPFIMPMLNKAIFLDEHGEEYIKVLLDICSTIEEDLRMLIFALKDMPREHQFEFYRDLGFLYNTDKPDVQKMLRKIASLLGNEGPITRLVEYVRKSQANGELMTPDTCVRMDSQDILHLVGMMSMGLELCPRINDTPS